jgi:hypothetical protein
MALYRKYYPNASQAEVFPRQRYNPNNAFNTTLGAMHLRQRANNLWAEVAIAALSTPTYTKGGVVLQSGADLCNEAGLGVATRASDPNIAETVNGAAQAGCRISLTDPIGLYMEPPSFKGWVTPDGSPPKALWTNERGNPMTRGSLKSSPDFKLSQVKIAGQPIEYGGQVAKLIDVHLTGLVSTAGTVAPVQIPVERLPSQSMTAAALFSLQGRKPSRTGR